MQGSEKARIMKPNLPIEASLTVTDSLRAAPQTSSATWASVVVDDTRAPLRKIHASRDFETKQCHSFTLFPPNVPTPRTAAAERKV